MEATTSSGTMAELLGRAAELRGSMPAIRFKRDGAWHDVTYAQASSIAGEIGRGLIALGLEPGDRVCILANTRPEWTYCDLGASAAGHYATETFGIRRLGDLLAERFGIDHQFVEIPNPI